MPGVCFHRMNIADLDFRALPVSERLQLVADIWDSIEADTPAGVSVLNASEADKAEWRRRLAEYDADPSIGIPWEDVRAEIFGPTA